MHKMWHYRDQCVCLLGRVFRGGDVADFEHGDHSQAALELVSTCFTICQELEDQGETGSAAHSTARILWVHILRSLSFLGLVKALKHLILVKRNNKESLVDFLCVGQATMSSVWHDEIPATEDDEVAYKELKELLRGLYDSTDIYFEQDDRDPANFEDQLRVVRAAVKFYMFVVLTAARGESKHSSELLDDAELYLGERWLLSLIQQGHAAKPADDFLPLALKDALALLDLALVLNHDPLGYQFGLPLD